MADRGEIPVQAITVVNQQQQRNNKLRCAGDSSTDNASSERSDACLEKLEKELWEQFTENQLEQNVIPTDVQLPTASYSPLETLVDCSTVATVFDVDQCMEDWADFLQCYNSSKTAAVHNLDGHIT